MRECEGADSEIERDVRRNLMLIERALQRNDWDAVLRLAEGLVRLAVKGKGETRGTTSNLL